MRVAAATLGSYLWPIYGLILPNVAVTKDGEEAAAEILASIFALDKT